MFPPWRKSTPPISAYILHQVTNITPPSPRLTITLQQLNNFTPVTSTALHCIYQNTKETITFFLNKLEPFFTKIYCDKYLFHSWLLKISSIKGKDTKRSSKRYRMVEKYRHNGKFKIKQMASWVSKLQKIVALSTT